MAHLAFLGHSHRSHEHVLSVAKVLRTRGVNYWLDTEKIELGDNILSRMQEGLDNATVLVAFFGAEGVDGKWQELEILTALDQSLRKKKKIIPVLLPGAVHSANLPSLLQGILHVNLRTTDDSQQLEQLVKAILATDTELQSEPEKPPSDTVVDDADEYQDLLKNFVYDATDVGVNFLIGPAAWSATRGLRTRISSKFLEELVRAGLLDSSKDLPVELAAIYFALFKKKEDAAARELSSIIGMLSPTPEEAVERLAAVLRKLSQRPTVGRQIHLVLTTNQDLEIERALLQAALPFTRMVRDVRKKCLIVEAYRFPQKEGFPATDGVYTKGSGGKSFPRPESVDQVTRLIEEPAGREFWYASQPDPRLVGRDTVTGLVPSFEFEDRPLLVLYKFKGSVDVRGSCVISADDLYDCAAGEGEALIPRQITSSILENMSVLLGYYPSDMDLRLLHRTLLRDMRRERDKPPKYAINPPPIQAKSVEEALREALEDQMCDWLQGQGFRTARKDLAVFLSNVLQAL